LIHAWRRAVPEPPEVATHVQTKQPVAAGSPTSLLLAVPAHEKGGTNSPSHAGTAVVLFRGRSRRRGGPATTGNHWP